MIAIEGLSAKRRGRTLFSNLTFSLRAGTWLCIRGANGCGKSTLLKMLIGLFPSSAGNCLGPITFIGHKTGLQLRLNPLENLQWFVGIQQGKSMCPLQALTILGLKNEARIPCELLSYGQRKRAALARLLIHKGKTWVLDEPLDGLDEAGIEIFTCMLETHLADDGRAIIASHTAVHADALRAPAEIITLGNISYVQ